MKSCFRPLAIVSMSASVFLKFVLRDVWVNFAVGAFQIGIADEHGAAETRDRKYKSYPDRIF